MPVILGNPVKTTNLVVEGSPALDPAMTLFVKGPTDTNKDMSFFMASPPDVSMSLVMNPDTDLNTTNTLYINAGDGSYDAWTASTAVTGSDVSNLSSAYSKENKRLNVQYNNAGLEGYIYFRAEHRNVHDVVLDYTTGSASGLWQVGAATSPYSPSSPFTSGGEEWQLRAVTGSQAGSGYIDLDFSNVIFASDDYLLLRWDSELSVWSNPPTHTSTLKQINDRTFPSAYQEYGTLSISGTPDYPSSTTFPLYLQADQIGSGISNATFFVSGNINVATGDASLFASGANAGVINTNSTLVVNSNVMSSGTMDLTISKDFNNSNIASLSIFSRAPSGVMPVSISGIIQTNNNTTLNIGNTKDPQPNDITLYTKGYLE